MYHHKFLPYHKKIKKLKKKMHNILWKVWSSRACTLIRRIYLEFIYFTIWYVGPFSFFSERCTLPIIGTENRMEAITFFSRSTKQGNKMYACSIPKNLKINKHNVLFTITIIIIIDEIHINTKCHGMHVKYLNLCLP